ncbi:MAG: hypothetical protein ABII00_06590 [Elusimicrobiota bacterium]
METRQSEIRFARLVPLLTGLGALALYLALPSHYYNFDGVACAIAVELGDLKHLVHGNHLLYGVAGHAFHQALLALGIPISALKALHLMDSLLGAAGAGLMCGLLRRQKFPDWIAALCAAGMAVTYGWWLWSLEAQVYILGTFFLLLSLDEALRDRPAPYRLALYHALAMLSHASHALFAPVALYALWRSHADRAGLRRALSRYLLTATIIVVAAYLAAAVWWVRPADMGELRVWLLGSAALGPGRTFLWYNASGPIDAVTTWCETGARLVAPWRLLALPLWGAALWALAFARERRLVWSAWLWIPAYAPLFLTYEPYNLDYRLGDLIPLWLMAALAVRRLTEIPYGKAISLLYVLTLGTANLAAGILPASRAEGNRTLQKALWLAETTPQDAWIAAMAYDEVYIPYFALRHPLNLRYFQGREDALGARIRRLEGEGRPVYVTSDIFPFGWREAFSRMRLQESGRLGDVILYRVSAPVDQRPKGKPKGRR